MDISRYFKKKESQKRSTTSTDNEKKNIQNEKETSKKVKLNESEIIDCTVETNKKEDKISQKKQKKVDKKPSKKIRVVVSSEDDDVFEKPKDNPKPTKVKTKVESSKVESIPKEKKHVAITSTYKPRWMQTDREPPKHGMKKIPIGKPNCLEGKLFVLTGLNESLTRDELLNVIKEYGGIERTSISKKTNYLVAGFEMEDGRPITEGSKYKAAIEKGIEIIDEDRVLKMIYDSNPEANKEIEKKPVISKEITEQPIITKKEVVKTASNISSKPSPEPDKTLLTSKYAPTSLQEVIGNKKVIESLQNWLERWEDVHIKKTLEIQPNRQNPGARAVLLSGPPGIGKTTTATLLCRLADYDIIELNASDKRNMASVRETLQDSVSAQAFSFTQKTNIKKKVILMDEVDGMSSGDRGGIQELIKIIKTTHTPIICICNDRDNPKVRTLANHCYDLQFNKPSPYEIQQRINTICMKEGLQLQSSTIQMIIESTSGDMRQILNQLQILISLKDKSTSSFDSIVKSFSKDQLLGVSAFEAGKSLLTKSTTLSLQQRYDLFFCDYELTPLVIQQNYINCIKSNNQPLEAITQMADTADALCDCENIHEMMVKNNNWSLLPSMAIMTIRAGYKATGRSVMPYFPMVLGKYSTIRKNTRLLGEFQSHLSYHISGSKQAIVRDYYDMLNGFITKPLEEGNVEEAIQRLDEYAITKEDYVDILNGIKLGNAKSRFEVIPTKTKSSFTRMYNNSNHLITNVYADDNTMFKKVTKGKKGKKESKQTMNKEKELEDMTSESDSEINYNY